MAVIQAVGGDFPIDRDSDDVLPFVFASSTDMSLQVRPSTIPGVSGDLNWILPSTGSVSNFLELPYSAPLASPPATAPEYEISWHMEFGVLPTRREIVPLNGIIASFLPLAQNTPAVNIVRDSDSENFRITSPFVFFPTVDLPVRMEIDRSYHIVLRVRGRDPSVYGTTQTTATYELWINSERVALFENAGTNSGYFHDGTGDGPRMRFLGQTRTGYRNIIIRDAWSDDGTGKPLVSLVADHQLNSASGPDLALTGTTDNTTALDFDTIGTGITFDQVVTSTLAMEGEAGYVQSVSSLQAEAVVLNTIGARTGAAAELVTTVFLDSGTSRGQIQTTYDTPDPSFTFTTQATEFNGASAVQDIIVQLTP